MIYITGDTHGSFDRVASFCQRMKTSREDILIVLGDAGLNFHGGVLDRCRKSYAAELPITLFCIHGNHEKRPASIPTYKLTPWRGGEVWMEDDYPSILFGRDGDIYDMGGRKSIVLGGAYSIDKPFRLLHGYPWFADEQPDDEIKARVEKQLGAVDWKVDVVLSHTVPLKYEPTEVFLHGVDQSKIDKSTEQWLGSIEERLQYEKWYAGHYHTTKKIDKLQLLYKDFDLFAE